MQLKEFLEKHLISILAAISVLLGFVVLIIIGATASAVTLVVGFAISEIRHQLIKGDKTKNTALLLKTEITQNLYQLNKVWDALLSEENNLKSITYHFSESDPPEVKNGKNLQLAHQMVIKLASSIPPILDSTIWTQRDHDLPLLLNEEAITKLQNFYNNLDEISSFHMNANSLAIKANDMPSQLKFWADYKSLIINTIESCNSIIEQL